MDLPAFARWSVDVRAADGGEILTHEPGRLLSTASVGKVFVLVELAERLRAGDVDAASPLDRGSVPLVADSGLWQHLSTPLLPVEDVATLVGAVSDNWATNVLLDRLGLPAVRRRARDWAPGGSDLVDVVRGSRGPTDPPHLSIGCAADWTGVLARLHAERGIHGSTGQRVLHWLAPGVDLSMVAAAFDQDPLAHAEDETGCRIVNKTGTNTGVRADIGLVTSASGHTVAYAVIANWPEEPPGSGRADVLAAMRRIGDRVRRELEDPR